MGAGKAKRGDKHDRGMRSFNDGIPQPSKSNNRDCLIEVRSRDGFISILSCIDVALPCSALA